MGELSRLTITLKSLVEVELNVKSPI